uniref:WASp n=1 Tax=Eptatretus burgeri TaxID=7764 RepID=A0A8C4N736_EPTBU
MAVPPPKKRDVNVSSCLLTADENDVLFSLVGKGNVIVASSVVQLLQGITGSWIKKDCGVACLIKNKTKRSYFISLFSLAERKCLWEQEFYFQMMYGTPLPYFHTIEGDTCLYGLNFAQEYECSFFAQKVQQKLHLINQRRTNITRCETFPRHIEGPKISPSHAKYPSKFNHENGIKIPKKNITKSLIGRPHNFQHLTHIRWTQQNKFDITKLDPQLESLFANIGIERFHLQDRRISRRISKIICDFGGIEAVKEQMKTENGRSKMTKSSPQGLAMNSAGTWKRPQPKQPPKVPPPPPPSLTTPGLPSEPDPQDSLVKASHQACPPSPPPLLSVPVSPPSPAPTKQPQPESSTPKPQSRGKLLNEIHMGIPLRPINKDGEKEKEGASDQPSLQDALRNAVQKIHKSMYDSDEDDEDDDEDDYDDESWDA